MTRALKLDKTHEHLIGLTVDNINMAIKDITEAHEIFTNISGMVHNEITETKDPYYPWGDYLVSYLALQIKMTLMTSRKKSKQFMTIKFTKQKF